MALAPRKVLLVVTTGGFTHAGKNEWMNQTSQFLSLAWTFRGRLTILRQSAAPVFEIAKVLAERGHAIEFATLDGQEHWTEGYEFITKVHLLGPGPTEEQMNAHYLRMQAWDISKGLGPSMDSKYLFDSFWPQTYRRLKEIMESIQPSMIVADFFAEAVKDIHVEYHVPITVVWPTMPWLMVSCSYIPGQPGFQLEGTSPQNMPPCGFASRMNSLLSLGCQQS